MRTDDLYLTDIIEAARAIAKFLEGMTRETFLSDDRPRSAVMWKLMIVGEACNKLSPAARAAFGETPWKEIRGFRNLIVHGYFTLEWGEVWRIAVQDIPQLQRQAEQALTVLGFSPLDRSEIREPGDPDKSNL